MEPVEREREATGSGLTGVPDRARHEQAGRRGSQRAKECDQGRERALAPLGPVEPDRDRRGSGKEREDELEVEPATAERRDTDEPEEGPEAPKRAERKLRCREQDVAGDH